VVYHTKEHRVNFMGLNIQPIEHLQREVKITLSDIRYMRLAYCDRKQRPV
jgi:hypothetical protein